MVTSLTPTYNYVFKLSEYYIRLGHYRLYNYTSKALTLNLYVYSPNMANKKACMIKRLPLVRNFQKHRPVDLLYVVIVFLCVCVCLSIVFYLIAFSI